MKGLVEMPWIVLSFFVALVLDSVPIGEALQAFNPPWTLLVLIYWCWIVPAHVGPFTGFFVGLLLDTMSASVLGVHGLGGSLVGFLANRLRPIFNTSSLWQQSIVVLGLVLVYKALVGWIQSFLAAENLDMTYWVSSLIVILAWPLVYTLLKELTPIRRRA
ncbi:MAG: Rod shape-determining protein MreD [Gammaproteobacteria bacterium]|nr:Rod shape-determining protein MreD [Gammaproteobacteria bacterium]